MELTFSNNSPINTNIANAEGQTLYKVVSPFKLGTRTTTISTLVPDDLLVGGEQDGELGHRSDRFAHLAQIEWRNIGHDKLRFGGMEYDAKSYLQPTGLLNQHRIFTGPDAIQYRWNLGVSGIHPPVLELNDQSKARVAMFHRCIGLLNKKSRDARLEIFDSGLHIVDAIVITFIYVDHLRRIRMLPLELEGVADVEWSAARMIPSKT